MAALLILAAGAYGLTRALSTTSSEQSTQPALSQASGPVDWLGMQLQSVTPGSVVIETIAPGSSAELAGLEPGDEIVEVNGRSISSTGQISGAVASLPAGAYVEIQVNRGSTPVTTHAALTGPPRNHP
jgi:S1-C subfamily serine protease